MNYNTIVPDFGVTGIIEGIYELESMVESTVIIMFVRQCWVASATNQENIVFMLND